jgi:hypothetical protein
LHPTKTVKIFGHCLCFCDENVSMACESGQGCGSGGGEGSCNTDSCASETSACNQSKPTLNLDNSQPRACTKCKEEDAPPNELLCASCLHTSLVSKFKTAVNKNSLVMPCDNVLLAFSGGPASRSDHLVVKPDLELFEFVVF